MGVHTKGRDNRELIIEPLIRDTSESLNKSLSEKGTLDRFIGSFFARKVIDQYIVSCLKLSFFSFLLVFLVVGCSNLAKIVFWL